MRTKSAASLEQCSSSSPWQKWKNSSTNDIFSHTSIWERFTHARRTSVLMEFIRDYLHLFFCSVILIQHCNVYTWSNRGTKYANHWAPAAIYILIILQRHKDILDSQKTVKLIQENKASTHFYRVFLSTVPHRLYVYVHSHSFILCSFRLFRSIPSCMCLYVC